MNKIILNSFIIVCLFSAQAGAQQAVGEPPIWRGWPMKGFPLLIYKNKQLTAFGTPEQAFKALEEQKATQAAGGAANLKPPEGGENIEAVRGDFVDVSDSLLRFIEPSRVKAESTFQFNCRDPRARFGVAAGQEFLVHYHDPYMLVVGDGRSICDIDLFYDKRPLPFKLEKRPRYEWWVEINEYKSFKKGWVLASEEEFYNDFNPRYLRNFNNRAGLMGDFETVFIFRNPDQLSLVGFYAEFGDYNAFNNKFKKQCIFVFRAERKDANAREYSVEALNIAPDHVSKMIFGKGRMRYGWRGETSTVIIQLEAQMPDCEDKLSVSDEPRFFYETKKNTPEAFGVLVARDIRLAPEGRDEYPPGERSIYDYSNIPRRQDFLYNYSSPDQYALESTTDEYEKSYTPEKWDFLYIYEIVNGWARVYSKRLRVGGWVRVSNIAIKTRFRDFPELKSLEQYIDDEDRAAQP